MFLASGWHFCRADLAHHAHSLASTPPPPTHPSQAYPLADTKYQKKLEFLTCVLGLPLVESLEAFPQVRLGEAVGTQAGRPFWLLCAKRH